MNVYFPSCNFSKTSPEAAKKIRAYLKASMPVAGCCRTDKTQRAQADTAVYFCQACREVVEDHMQTRSLWEYLDADSAFPFPDYSGLRMNLQDCWRDRDHPEIHEAVRNLLKKMHIEFTALSPDGADANFCGNLHAEPENPAILAEMEQYSGKPIYEMPPSLEEAIMREQAAKCTERWVVAYCNRCKLGLTTGGASAVHLLELLMGTAKL